MSAAALEPALALAPALLGASPTAHGPLPVPVSVMVTQLPALRAAGDPVFGPVAMVGLGGIFIEVLKDVTFRRCPFGVAEAEEMIRNLKGFPLPRSIRLG